MHTLWIKKTALKMFTNIQCSVKYKKQIRQIELIWRNQNKVFALRCLLTLKWFKLYNFQLDYCFEILRLFHYCDNKCLMRYESKSDGKQRTLQRSTSNPIQIKTDLPNVTKMIHKWAIIWNLSFRRSTKSFLAHLSY